MDDFYNLVKDQEKNDPDFHSLLDTTAGKLSPVDENASNQSENAHPAFGNLVFAIQAFENGFIFSLASDEVDKEAILRCLEAIQNQILDNDE